MGFRFWIALAGVLGAIGVVMGALGAHALSGNLDGHAGVLFEKAWRYHMLHVFALLSGAWLIWLFDHGRNGPGAWSAKAACWFFLAGILFFSGVLYVQALVGGQPALPVVPVGGTSFIVGWLLIAVSGFRIPRF